MSRSVETGGAHFGQLATVVKDLHLGPGGWPSRDMYAHKGCFRSVAMLAGEEARWLPRLSRGRRRTD